MRTFCLLLPLKFQLLGMLLFLGTVDTWAQPCDLTITLDVGECVAASSTLPVNVTISDISDIADDISILLDNVAFPWSPVGIDPFEPVVFTCWVTPGAFHQIFAQSLEVASCQATNDFWVPQCACSMDIMASVTGPCTADQTVPVNINVNASPPSGAGFNLFIDGSLQAGSPFPYSASSATSITVFVPGTGSNHSIQVNDAGNTTCTDLVDLFTPLCATASCSLTATAVVTGSCNANNQVPVGLTVTSSGAGNAGFNVFLDGTLVPGSPYLYAAGSSTVVSLLANGNGAAHLIQVQDAQLLTCSASTSITTPNCILPCALTATAAVTGSCNTSNQVPVGLTVTSSGAGNAGFNVFLDGALVPGSPYLYAAGSSTVVNLLVNGNGTTHLIQVQDLQTLTCTASTNITTPNCISACNLAAAVVVSGSCDSNFQTQVTVNITATGQGNNGINLFLDGSLLAGSPFPYAASSTTVVTFPVNGDGANHTVIVQDAGIFSCSATAGFQTPVCAGGPCNIGTLRTTIGAHQVYTITVDDNFYTPANLEVVTGDTIRFVWIGAHLHTVTSDTLSGDDSFNSGLHGPGYTYDVVLKNPGTHPYYCIPHGSPGGIGMSGVLIAADPCADGLLAVGLAFTNANGNAQGYSIQVDGSISPGSPFVYAVSGNNTQTIHIPGDGNDHQITVTDVTDPSCKSTITVGMPDCSDPCFGFNTAADFTINHFDLTVDFSVPAPASNTSYTWDFGDGTSGTGETVVHTFPASGAYMVCVWAESSSGCFDSTCYQLVLQQTRCEANFNWTNNGLTTTFSNLSAATVPIGVYQWDFGDGGISSAESPAHTFATTGVYTVCLTITADTCVTTYCETLDLSDPCLILTPGYSYTTVGGPLQLQFTDLTSGDPDQWLWGFGDGQTSFVQHPAHTYAVPGIYNVCLIAGNTSTGCFAPVFCQAIGAGVSSVGAPPAVTSLTVFPNPVNNHRANVAVTGIQEQHWGQPMQVSFTGIDGRTAGESTLTGAAVLSIPVPEGMAAGIYLIKILGNDRVYTGKMIIY